LRNIVALALILEYFKKFSNFAICS